MKTSTPMTGWPTMKKNGSDNIANISMGDRNSLPQTSTTHEPNMFTRRHHSIDQVVKQRGANKMLVDESVYSFKKTQGRDRSIQISTTLAPLDDKSIMKAMLIQMGKPVVYSTTPSVNLTLNEQSTLDINDRGTGLSQSITSREFIFNNKTRNTANNTQTNFLSSKMQPTLPALNETKEPNTVEASPNNSPRKQQKKFFFATRQVSESVGEKEDPLQARKDRLRLSQIALKSIGKSNDSTLAGLIYRNQVATQKNLVGVRSIRRSINKDYSTIGTA